MRELNMLLNNFEVIKIDFYAINSRVGSYFYTHSTYLLKLCAFLLNFVRHRGTFLSRHIFLFYSLFQF